MYQDVHIGHLALCEVICTSGIQCAIISIEALFYGRIFLPSEKLYNASSEQ